MRLQQIFNELGDETALVNIDTKEVIVKGDYYHDKIDKYIAGFIYGLEYLNVDFELLNDLCVNPDNELFKFCGFYEEED